MKPQLQIALALIWREGEILISRRRHDADHLPDLWEFPGGKVQSGETPQQAAIREAREEIGAVVAIVAAREAIEWDYPERCVTLYPFDCRIIGGKIEAREVAEVRFVLPSELRADDFPAANSGLVEQIKTGSR